MVLVAKALGVSHRAETPLGSGNLDPNVHAPPLAGFARLPVDHRSKVRLPPPRPSLLFHGCSQHCSSRLCPADDGSAILCLALMLLLLKRVAFETAYRLLGMRHVRSSSLRLDCPSCVTDC